MRKRPNLFTRSSIALLLVLVSCYRIQSEALSDSEQYHEKLMQNLLSPILNTEEEVHRWAFEYDEHLGESIEQDTLLTSEDYRLVQIIRDFLPSFLTTDYTIQGKLFIAFQEGVTRRQEIISEMRRAYYEIEGIFLDRVGLEPPPGYIFVLVVRDRDVIGNKELGGFVIRSSRFIVIPQAFYYQYGFRMFNSDQFHKTFKHELVHAFINAIAGYHVSIQLPEWFHEMAAISLGGNRKISIRGETMNKLSDLYQEYYDAARFLQKKHGNAAYNQFIRQSIRDGDPQAQLIAVFGYKKYDELRWESMNIFEKLSEKTGKSWKKLKNAIYQLDVASSVFIILMLSLPFFIVYWAINDNIIFIKNMRGIYASAVDHEANRQLTRSLITFREFVRESKKTNSFERLFIRMKRKLDHALESINSLQEKILREKTENIRRLETSDLFAAEECCFDMEITNKSLFDGRFLKEARQFLDQCFPRIIEQSWQQRINHASKLVMSHKYPEAIRFLYNYVAIHRKSKYIPHEQIIGSVNEIMEQAIRSYEEPDSSVDVRTHFPQYQDLSPYLKRGVPQRYKEPLGAFLLEVASYGTLREVRMIVEEKAVFYYLEAMEQIIEVLQIGNPNSCIKRNALSLAQRIFEEWEQQFGRHFTDEEKNSFAAVTSLKEYSERLIDIIDSWDDAEEWEEQKTAIQSFG